MKEKYITDLRAFNRFYTRIIGLLDKYILNSRYSLPEVRVLYEMYQKDSITSKEIVSSLHIDKGYLSRIIRRFEKKRLVIRKSSDKDGRSNHLYLTSLGKKEFEKLNDASQYQVNEILSNLTEQECENLIRHMAEIKTILSKNTK